MKQTLLQNLEVRLIELIALPLDPIKLEPVRNLIVRYTTELDEKITKCQNIDEIKQVFNHYIKNILSIVETLISGDSYLALRRLLLNEIHGCQNAILEK